MPAERRHLAVLLLAAPSTALAQEPLAAQELPDLDARIQALSEELDAARAELGAVETDAPFDKVRQRRDSTLAPSTGLVDIAAEDLSLRIGGYVKMDGIHDFQRVGNASKFATATIPVPTEDQERTTFQARETRLNVDVRSGFKAEAVRFFVEGDFYGAGGAFNLRHAYGEYGGLLAGQTWTTFMDLSSRPVTLDFEGPDGALFLRQPMVRWTQAASNTTSWSLALEGASQGVGALGGVDPNLADAPLPDLTGNLRREVGPGHLQLSGVLRKLRYEGGAGEDAVIGWGLALSGKTPVGPRGRRLMAQLSVGEGTGEYNQALRDDGQSDAFLGADGRLEALGNSTATVGVENDWNADWSTTVAYSVATLDNVTGQAADVLHQTQSTSATLLWHPTRHFLAGVEYLYGTRENNDGQRGHANRVMFSFKFFL